MIINNVCSLQQMSRIGCQSLDHIFEMHFLPKIPLPLIFHVREAERVPVNIDFCGRDVPEVQILSRDLAFN